MTWTPQNIDFAKVTVTDAAGDLFGLLSWPTDRDSRGLILLPPGYERRIHHYAVLSYLFVEHGYTTLRFDLRNHIGYSEGEVADFTMSSVATDVQTAMRFSKEARFSHLPCYVVAPSLAGRGAMRAIATAEAPAGLVTLMPVVDVRHTLSQVAGEDLIPKWESGEVTDASRLYLISKHYVAARFGQDAVEQDWGGVSQTVRDTEAIDCPMYAIAAEQDEWVRAEDVKTALSGSSKWPRHCTIMEASSHDIARNLPVLRLMLELSLDAVNAIDGSSERAVLPDFSTFVDIVTAERRWAKGEYKSLPAEPGAQARPERVGVPANNVTSTKDEGTP